MSGSGFNFFNFNNLMRQAQVILRTGGFTPSDLGLPGMPAGPNVGGQPTMPQVPLTPLEVRMATLAALFADPNTRLTSEETPRFLQDALKLPHEVKTILAMLDTEETPTPASTLDKSLKELITEKDDGKLAVPMDALQDQLAKGAKDATDKMMKLVQGNTMSQTGAARQLAELTTTLGKLGEAVKASPAKATETLMLLYLPWYPLAAPRDLHVDFEGGSGGEEGGEEDISVVLYVNTNMLGRFKVAVRELNPLQIVIDLSHEKVAESILPNLEKDLNEVLAKDGLPAAVFNSTLIEAEALTESPALDIPATDAKEGRADGHDTTANHAAAGFKFATRQSDRKAIQLQPGGRLSVLVLNTAYAVAKLIFEADEQNTHLQRKRSKPQSQPKNP